MIEALANAAITAGAVTLLALSLALVVLAVRPGWAGAWEPLARRARGALLGLAGLVAGLGVAWLLRRRESPPGARSEPVEPSPPVDAHREDRAALEATHALRVRETGEIDTPADAEADLRERMDRWRNRDDA